LAEAVATVWPETLRRSWLTHIFSEGTKGTLHIQYLFLPPEDSKVKMYRENWGRSHIQLTPPSDPPRESPFSAMLCGGEEGGQRISLNQNLVNRITNKVSRQNINQHN
jgi:hypothetical protein